VDKEHIVAYTLSALAKEQLNGSDAAEKAFKKYKINKDKDFSANL
jgi:pyruvate dehydrogenase E1 component